MDAPQDPAAGESAAPTLTKTPPATTTKDATPAIIISNADDATNAEKSTDATVKIVEAPAKPADDKPADASSATDAKPTTKPDEPKESPATDKAPADKSKADATNGDRVDSAPLAPEPSSVADIPLPAATADAASSSACDDDKPAAAVKSPPVDELLLQMEAIAGAVEGAPAVDKCDSTSTAPAVATSDLLKDLESGDEPPAPAAASVDSTSAEATSATDEPMEVDAGDRPSASDEKPAAVSSTDDAIVSDLDDSVAQTTAEASAALLDRSLVTPVPSVAAAKPANKLLANMMNNGSSTPNSNPVSAAGSPNVFNSTPIERQFEISSENVSKIDAASTNTSSVAAAKDASTVVTSPTSSSASSSDNLSGYVKALKQLNGLDSDASTATDEKSSGTAGGSAPVGGSRPLSGSGEPLPFGSEYLVSVRYEQSEIVSLNVQRQRPAGSSAPDASGTSNGSVTSIGPFSLPSATGSSLLSSSSASSAVQPATSIRKIFGSVLELADFMVEHFTQLRRELTGSGGDAAATPSAAGRKAAVAKKQAARIETPKTPVAATARRNKRAAATTPTAELKDEQPTAKKVKTETEAPATGSLVPVLARWSDRKYYAGRLKESKPNRKYVIVFEDGATKTLAHELVIFGNESGTLPLLEQYVHARIDDETYEPGLVTDIQRDTDADAVLYTVITESQTVKVGASELYLEDDQAKLIQKAVEAAAAAAPTAAPLTPVKAATTAPAEAKQPATPAPKTTPVKAVADAATPAKRVGRQPAKLADASAAKRPKQSPASGKPVQSPEPSTSAEASRAVGRRGNKRYS